MFISLGYHTDAAPRFMNDILISTTGEIRVEKIKDPESIDMLGFYGAKLGFKVIKKSSTSPSEIRFSNINISNRDGGAADGNRYNLPLAIYGDVFGSGIPSDYNYIWGGYYTIQIPSEDPSKKNEIYKWLLDVKKIKDVEQNKTEDIWARFSEENNYELLENVDYYIDAETETLMFPLDELSNIKGFTYEYIENEKKVIMIFEDGKYEYDFATSSIEYFPKNKDDKNFVNFKYISTQEEPYTYSNLTKWELYSINNKKVSFEIKDNKIYVPIRAVSDFMNISIFFTNDDLIHFNTKKEAR